MMLSTLLKPCHTRLTGRCWHKHGRLAWLGAPAHLRIADSQQKSRKQHQYASVRPLRTACAVARQPVPLDQSSALHLAETGMSWQGRSIGCGQVREHHIGQSITICGWVHRHRDLRGCLFCDIRDSSGILQVQPQTLQFTILRAKS